MASKYIYVLSYRRVAIPSPNAQDAMLRFRQANPRLTEGSEGNTRVIFNRYGATDISNIPPRLNIIDTEVVHSGLDKSSAWRRNMSMFHLLTMITRIAWFSYHVPAVFGYFREYGLNGMNAVWEMFSRPSEIVGQFGPQVSWINPYSSTVDTSYAVSGAWGPLAHVARPVLTGLTALPFVALALKQTNSLYRSARVSEQIADSIRSDRDGMDTLHILKYYFGITVIDAHPPTTDAVPPQAALTQHLLRNKCIDRSELEAIKQNPELLWNTLYGGSQHDRLRQFAEAIVNKTAGEYHEARNRIKGTFQESIRLKAIYSAVRNQKAEDKAAYIFKITGIQGIKDEQALITYIQQGGLTPQSPETIRNEKQRLCRRVDDAANGGDELNPARNHDRVLAFFIDQYTSAADTAVENALEAAIRWNGSTTDQQDFVTHFSQKQTAKADNFHAEDFYQTESALLQTAARMAIATVQPTSGRTPLFFELNRKNPAMQKLSLERNANNPANIYRQFGGIKLSDAKFWKLVYEDLHVNAPLQFGAGLTMCIAAVAAAPLILPSAALMYISGACIVSGLALTFYAFFIHIGYETADPQVLLNSRRGDPESKMQTLKLSWNNWFSSKQGPVFYFLMAGVALAGVNAVTIPFAVGLTFAVSVNITHGLRFVKGLITIMRNKDYNKIDLWQENFIMCKGPRTSLAKVHYAEPPDLIEQAVMDMLDMGYYDRLPWLLNGRLPYQKMTRVYNEMIRRCNRRIIDLKNHLERGRSILQDPKLLLADATERVRIAYQRHQVATDTLTKATSGEQRTLAQSRLEDTNNQLNQAREYLQAATASQAKPTDAELLRRAQLYTLANEFDQMSDRYHAWAVSLDVNVALEEESRDNLRNDGTTNLTRTAVYYRELANLVRHKIADPTYQSDALQGIDIDITVVNPDREYDNMIKRYQTATLHLRGYVANTIQDHQKAGCQNNHILLGLYGRIRRLYEKPTTQNTATLDIASVKRTKYTRELPFSVLVGAALTDSDASETRTALSPWDNLTKETAEQCRQHFRNQQHCISEEVLTALPRELRDQAYFELIHDSIEIDTTGGVLRIRYHEEPRHLPNGTITAGGELVEITFKSSSNPVYQTLLRDYGKGVSPHKAIIGALRSVKGGKMEISLNRMLYIPEVPFIENIAQFRQGTIERKRRHVVWVPYKYFPTLKYPTLEAVVTNEKRDVTVQVGADSSTLQARRMYRLDPIEMPSPFDRADRLDRFIRETIPVGDPARQTALDFIKARQEAIIADNPEYDQDQRLQAFKLWPELKKLLPEVYWAEAEKMYKSSPSEQSKEGKKWPDLETNALQDHFVELPDNLDAGPLDLEHALVTGFERVILRQPDERSVRPDKLNQQVYLVINYEVNKKVVRVYRPYDQMITEQLEPPTTFFAYEQNAYDIQMERIALTGRGIKEREPDLATASLQDDQSYFLMYWNNRRAESALYVPIANILGEEYRNRQNIRYELDDDGFMRFYDDNNGGKLIPVPGRDGKWHDQIPYAPKPHEMFDPRVIYFRPFFDQIDRVTDIRRRGKPAIMVDHHDGALLVNNRLGAIDNCPLDTNPARQRTLDFSLGRYLAPIDADQQATWRFLSFTVAIMEKAHSLEVFLERFQEFYAERGVPADIIKAELAKIKTEYLAHCAGNFDIFKKKVLFVTSSQYYANHLFMDKIHNSIPVYVRLNALLAQWKEENPALQALHAITYGTQTYTETDAREAARTIIASCGDSVVQLAESLPIDPWHQIDRVVALKMEQEGGDKARALERYNMDAGQKRLEYARRAWCDLQLIVNHPTAFSALPEPQQAQMLNDIQQLSTYFIAAKVKDYAEVNAPTDAERNYYRLQDIRTIIPTISPVFRDIACIQPNVDATVFYEWLTQKKALPWVQAGFWTGTNLTNHVGVMNEKVSRRMVDSNGVPQRIFVYPYTVTEDMHSVLGTVFDPKALELLDDDLKHKSLTWFEHWQRDTSEALFSNRLSLLECAMDIAVENLVRGAGPDSMMGLIDTQQPRWGGGTLGVHTYETRPILAREGALRRMRFAKQSAEYYLSGDYYARFRGWGLDFINAFVGAGFTVSMLGVSASPMTFANIDYDWFVIFYSLDFVLSTIAWYSTQYGTLRKMEHKQMFINHYDKLVKEDDYSKPVATVVASYKVGSDVFRIYFDYVFGSEGTISLAFMYSMSRRKETVRRRASFAVTRTGDGVPRMQPYNIASMGAVAAASASQIVSGLYLGLKAAGTLATDDKSGTQALVGFVMVMWGSLVLLKMFGSLVSRSEVSIMTGEPYRLHYLLKLSILPTFRYLLPVYRLLAPVHAAILEKYLDEIEHRLESEGGRIALWNKWGPTKTAFDGLFYLKDSNLADRLIGITSRVTGQNDWQRGSNFANSSYIYSRDKDAVPLQISA